MNNFLKTIKKSDSLTFVAIFSALLLGFICIENTPRSFPISRDFYFFLNSFFGYKFFSKHISFFMSDLLVLSIFGIAFYKLKARVFCLNTSSKYLLTFAVFLIISLMLSPYRIRSSQCLMIFNFFTTFLFFQTVSALVNEKNIHRYLQIVLLGLLLISLFEAFTGIYQYLMQKGLGMRKLHEANFSVSNLTLGSFHSTDGCRWILDNIFHVKRDTETVLRATGTISHANPFGGFMCFSTLSTIYLYLFSKKKLFSAFLLTALFFQVFAMWVSFSRAAIITFIIATVCLFAISYFKYFNLPLLEKFRLKKFLSFASIYFILSFVLLFPQISHRGGFISYTSLAKDSDTGRVQAQKVAFEVIKKNPLTGIGIDNFFTYNDSYIPYDLKDKKVPKMVHNIFLLIASEEGLIGLLFFLLFIISLYRTNFKNSSLTSLVFMIYFSAILIMGCADFYLFFFPQGKFLLFFPATVLGSLGCIEKKSKEELLSNLS